MRLTIACAPLLILAACDPSSPPPPPSPNTAPSFTSATTASVAENTGTVFYTAVATDPEGDTLTYTLSGADAGKFQIASGGLSFRSPPNFEVPSDQGANNVYDVDITATDRGGLTARLALAVTVTDSAGGAIRARRIASGLTQPVYVAGLADGSGRVLVVQKTGQIRVVTPVGGAIAATPFLDVSGSISTVGERGLLGLALAPDFATSGIAYVSLADPAGNFEVRRYTTVGGDRSRLDPASADIILRVPRSGTANYGGWLGFDKRGFLYIALGDAADCEGTLTATTIKACNARQGDGQKPGRILAIDVATDAYPGDPDRDYAIPATNPKVPGNEVFGFGVRNPHRASFDRLKGDFWFGDQGATLQEEINFKPYFSDRPDNPWSWPSNNINFSIDRDWPYYEGTAEKVFDTSFMRGERPQLWYQRSTGAIVGGYIYRGPVEALDALYIFADRALDRIYSWPGSGNLTVRTDFVPTAGTIDDVISFGEDETGNLYIVDFDGEVFLLESA